MTTPTPMAFMRLVVDGRLTDIARCLADRPDLARTPAVVGATRQDPSPYYVPDIARYLYAGDTPLHMAAAACRRDVAALLVAHGAACRARNRLGAEPLHDASVAITPDSAAQEATIAYLLSVGADPNAVDRSGVAPLHRAVRSRSFAAVRALVAGGADPMRRNRSGSTPLHLAVQTTGRSGSGSPEARRQQAAIIRFLIEHGANPGATDGRGRTVAEAASSRRVIDVAIAPDSRAGDSS